jgi:hypothetical protein
MRSNEDFLRAVLLIFELSSVNSRRHPFDSERGPGQSMGIERFIEEGCMLLEDLLLVRIR